MEIVPDQYTNRVDMLPVTGGHQLQVHDWGNPSAAVPVIRLHGGPGLGTIEQAKQVFDPTRQRVLLPDQRGSGQSLPKGGLEHNTTQNLVDDISRIADHAKLGQFVIVGGSWGSCLGLAYGIQHAERVSSEVLTGIFTGTAEEMADIDDGLVATKSPEAASAWQDYLRVTPVEFRENPTAYHNAQMLSGNPQAVQASAWAYERYVDALNGDEPEAITSLDSNKSVICAHYAVNKNFLADNYVLDNTSKLTMPIKLIQSVDDLVTLPAAAIRLNSQLPDSELFLTGGPHIGNNETGTLMRRLIAEATGTTTD